MQPESDRAPSPLPTRGSPVLMPLLVLGLAVGASAFVLLLVRLTQPPPRADQDLAAAAEKDLERRNFRPLSGALETLLKDETYRPIPTQTHTLLGQEAPGFTLEDTDGKSWVLAEHLKKGPVVVVFYYGYHCDHCVSQLFGIHKDIDKFRELGASVVAVSADPPDLTRSRYKKFGAFAFPVVSDPGNKVAEAYGTFAPGRTPGDEGKLAHGTFVLDRQGKMRWANRGDEPFMENRTLLIELHRGLE